MLLTLPKDPIMCLSVINTHLRDEYPSLEELCKSAGVNMQDITECLAKINYHYDIKRNQFV